MNKHVIFPEVAAAPGSSQLTETINMEYIQKNGLWVVEERVVPVHFPLIKLSREIDTTIDENLKGLLINIHV